MNEAKQKIIPEPIQKVAEAFEGLPGIGPRTALRLAFYLLHVPQIKLEEFAKVLIKMKKQTKTCSICLNITLSDPCPVCTDKNRDKSVICVVEHPLDILAIEKSGQFKGVYHVLHGAISPLNDIGPDEIRIAELLKRIDKSQVSEVILATNLNMEGEATAMYIAKKIRELKNKETEKIKISRLGQGLSNGTDLEYADEKTIFQALEGRKDY